MSKVDLTYQQIESVLAVLHDIGDDSRAAFRARLKHLQRNEFPPGVNTGKGRPARYSFANLMQMVVALEFIQSGMSPQLAVKLVTGNWSTIRAPIVLASYHDLSLEDDNIGPVDDWLLMVHPEALRSLTVEGDSEYDHYEAVRLTKIEEPIDRWAEELFGVGGARDQRWRALVIHATRLTIATMATVAFHFGYCSWEAMRREIVAEADDDAERMRKFSKELREDSKMAVRLKQIRNRRKKLEAELAERVQSLLPHLSQGMREALQPKYGYVKIEQHDLQKLLDYRLIRKAEKQFEITELGMSVADAIREQSDGEN